jgi:hypothetical protein
VAVNTVYHEARHPSAIVLPVVPAAKGKRRFSAWAAYRFAE